LNRIDLGFRSFNPTTGIFDRADPMAEMTPDFSPFSYVFNNPVNFIDEFGLMGSGWNTRGREETDAEKANKVQMDKSDNKEFIQGGYRDVMTQTGTGVVPAANTGNENESWYQKAWNSVSNFWNSEFDSPGTRGVTSAALGTDFETYKPTFGDVVVSSFVQMGKGYTMTADLYSRAGGYTTTPKLPLIKRTYTSPTLTKLNVGTFSINNFIGYPTGIAKPKGPFRIISGQEYTTARNSANKANAAIHKTDPNAKGKQIHEIHPVKFGGSLTLMNNKVYLFRTDHIMYTNFWNKLLKDLTK
jgi:hypothetical protein